MRLFYKVNNCFRTLIIGLSLMMMAGYADAQIKIGTNGAIIAPASLLELESANQGLLLPRLPDTVAINSLNPPNGMLIYLTKVPAVGLYVRKVTGWEYLTGSLGGNGNFNSLTVSGSVTAGSFSGPLTGNATSATTALTATNSLNSNVIVDPNNTAVTYPTFVLNSPGNAQLRTNNSFTFLPNTGTLSATRFVGPLTGNVTGTATNAIDATNAANTAITNDNSSPGANYVTFVAATSLNQPQKVSSAGLTFVPGTGTLNATTFNGNLIGNATTATSAVIATNAVNSAVTTDGTSSTSSYPVFVNTSAPGNFPLKTNNASLTYVASTGNLSSTRFTGNLTGNVTGIATQAIDATNAANVGITDITAPGVQYPTFVSAITGNTLVKTSSSNLTFNASTGILTATGFSGPIAGNATSSTNTTTTTITNDNATATPVFPTFVTGTSGPFGQRVSSTNLNFVPSTGVLTSGSYVSTVTTGTAPLVVSSSTTVANLSATNAVNTFITDDPTTSTPVYPTFVLGTGNNFPHRASTAKLFFVPSTGALTATTFVSTVPNGTPPFSVTSTTQVPNLYASQAPANGLTGTTLAPGVVTSSLTTVGTINTGFWNAGSVSTTQLKGRSALPTILAGASAGTGSGISIIGTDVAGVVTVVVNNAGPAGAGPVAVVTYNTSFSNGSYPVLYPANARTAQIAYDNQIYATGTGVGASFTIFIGTSFLPIGVYSWNYHVIGN